MSRPTPEEEVEMDPEEAERHGKAILTWIERYRDEQGIAPREIVAIIITCAHLMYMALKGPIGAYEFWRQMVVFADDEEEKGGQA